MQNSNNKYSLWLCPAPQFEVILSDQIIVLSEVLSSTGFDPHITLCSPVVGEIALLKKALNNLATKYTTVAVQPTEFSFTEEFYKSLFIQIQNNSSLSNLQKSALQIFGSTEPREFDPHISMAYKQAADFDANKCIENLSSQLLDPLLFNRIALYETSGELKDWSCAAEIILHD